jgi:hypothetical protein
MSFGCRQRFAPPGRVDSSNGPNPPLKKPDEPIVAMLNAQGNRRKTSGAGACARISDRFQIFLSALTSSFFLADDEL